MKPWTRVRTASEKHVVRIKSTVTVSWADDHLRRYGKKFAELPTLFEGAASDHQSGRQQGEDAGHSNTDQQPGPSPLDHRGSDYSDRWGGKKLSYDMETRGGIIRFNHVKPRETRKGAVARLWVPMGTLHEYPGVFTRDGKFPQSGK